MIDPIPTICIALSAIAWLVIFSAQRHNSRMRKELTEAELTLVRFEEACRWCASENVRISDLRCYAHSERSIQMTRWEWRTGKNVMLVENFIEYVREVTQ